MSSSAQEMTLRLERSFQAPAEDVFDAWTSPEVLRRWWMVEPDWRVPVADVDLRVGGGYRLSMEDREGVRRTVTGEYREVRRPELLVYSWSWELEGGAIGHVSTVTVEFKPDGDATMVVLTHSDLEDEGSREGHGKGWIASLQMLQDRVFAF